MHMGIKEGREHMTTTALDRLLAVLAGKRARRGQLSHVSPPHTHVMQRVDTGARVQQMHFAQQEIRGHVWALD
jgi:hypothetical protein